MVEAVSARVKKACRNRFSHRSQPRAADAVNDAPLRTGGAGKWSLRGLIPGVCAGVWVLLVFPFPLLATTVEEKDLGTLCEEAERAFLGTVGEVRSRWADAEKRSVETLIGFTDVTPLFGNVPHNVVVRFPGGEIDGIREGVVGLPQLRPGDRVILLLKEGGINPIVGFHQGFFRVTDGPAGPSVRISARNLHLDGSDGSAAADVADQGSRSASVPLDMFLDLLRQEFRRRQERP